VFLQERDPCILASLLVCFERINSADWRGKNRQVDAAVLDGELT